MTSFTPIIKLSDSEEEPPKTTRSCINPHCTLVNHCGWICDGDEDYSLLITTPPAMTVAPPEKTTPVVVPAPLPTRDFQFVYTRRGRAPRDVRPTEEPIVEPSPKRVRTDDAPSIHERGEPSSFVRSPARAEESIEFTVAALSRQCGLHERNILALKHGAMVDGKRLEAMQKRLETMDEEKLMEEEIVGGHTTRIAELEARVTDLTSRLDLADIRIGLTEANLAIAQQDLVYAGERLEAVRALAVFAMTVAYAVLFPGQLM